MMSTRSWPLVCILCVVASTPCASLAQSQPQLRLTRELRIDAAANDLTLIAPPGGIAVSPRGTIAITQNQDGTVRFFDAEGKPSGTFGRKGQGPGEFQTMTRFTWIGDTLVVSDQSTRRLTLISADGKLVRTVPWLSAVTAPAKAGSEAPRLRAGFPQARYSDGSMLLAVSLATGSATPDWPGGEQPGVPFIRVDSAGLFQRLITWSPRQQCTATFDSGNGPGSGFLTIPFCPQTLEEVSPDGSRFALVAVESASSPAYRLSVFRANGDTVFSRSFPCQRVTISREVMDSARATRARGSQAQRDAGAAMQIPDAYPPISRLMVGRDETIWLERNEAGGQKSWLILDGRGTPIGRAVAPAGVQIMTVARDAAWAIETDDVGLQHVVRFRVTR